MLVNFDNIKPKFLFVGKELEGPLFGTSTLFVSDDVPITAILDIQSEQADLSFNHVYFGANHLSRINLNSVCAVFEKLEQHYITLELADWNKFLSVLAKQDLDTQQRLKNVLMSPRVFIMCCVYKGPQRHTFHSNTQILDTPYLEGILKHKSASNLLVKIETERGVYVSTVSSHSETPWDSYKGDVTVWEETVNSN